MHARTRRQKEILDFITRYISKHGHRPSYQVIGRETGINAKSGVHKHIKALEEQGLLERRRVNGTFDLEIKTAAAGSDSFFEIPWLDVPLNGTRLEEWEQFPLIVPSFMFAGREAERYYAYRVRDNGLCEKNILEDDVILVERRSLVRDGECAVAVVDRETTVFRRYYRRGSRVELQASNDDFEPIVRSAEKVDVKGIYRALLRPAG
ncbi:MAG: LexA family protein [Pyrinomonadaceae bacterium]